MKRTDEISRVVRRREEAGRAYDKLSTYYYILIDRLERKCREEGLAKLAVGEGESVLEIGFGTGSSIVAIARAVGSGGSVVGIDLSERMVAMAQARVDKAQLSSRVKLAKCDAVHTTLPDDTFDAVFMSYVLELFDTPDIPVVLAQCLRVLRPGGRICVVALSKEGRETVSTKLYELGHKLLPCYLDCRPIFPARSLATAGFEIQDAKLCSMYGLDVEVVLATKPNRRLSTPQNVQ